MLPSAAVEHTSRTQDAVGSNPARVLSFVTLFLKYLLATSKYHVGLVMAPRTSLERLPSIRDSFAVRQVIRE